MTESNPFELDVLVAALQQSLQNAVLKPQPSEESTSPISYQVGEMNITLPVYLKGFESGRVFFETVDTNQMIRDGKQSEVECLEPTLVSFKLKPTVTEYEELRTQDASDVANDLPTEDRTADVVQEDLSSEQQKDKGEPKK